MHDANCVSTPIIQTHNQGISTTVRQAKPDLRLVGQLDLAFGQLHALLHDLPVCVGGLQRILLRGSQDQCGRDPLSGQVIFWRHFGLAGGGKTSTAPESPQLAGPSKVVA